MPALSEPIALAVDVVTEPSTWDREVLALGGHPLQLWGWGEVKAAGSWRAHRLRVTEGGATVGLAQLLVRPLPAQFKALSYVPRGPVVAHHDGETAQAVFGVGDTATRNAVTNTVVEWARENVGGVGITIEPDWPAGTGLDLAGRRYSPNQIMIPSTLILDLTQTPEELQAAMSRSTRADVRKGGRGVEVRRVVTDDEVRGVLAVYKETAERAGFALHEDKYYLDIHHELGEHSVLVAAFADGVPCAFAGASTPRRTSFQLYGGINDAGRKARPPPRNGAPSSSPSSRPRAVRHERPAQRRHQRVQEELRQAHGRARRLDRRRVLALVQHLEHGPADGEEGSPQAPRRG